MRAAPLLAALGLVACTGDGPVDVESRCEVSDIDHAWPSDGEDPVSRSASLTLSFEGEASLDATDVTVRSGGDTVPGAVEVLDGQVVWTPSDLMSADADHSWEATVCDADASGAFVTGAHGETVDPSSVESRAFSLDLSVAEWVEPEGGGALFASFFGGVMLLGVQAADESEIDLIGAVGEVVVDEEYDEEWIQQDPCYETVDFPATAYDNNPYVSVGPADMELEVQGAAVTLRDVEITGALVDEGDRIADASLVAEADARDLSAYGSASDLCDMLELYVGVPCSACSEDDEPYCLPVHVIDIDGERVPGLTVQPNEDPAECEDE